MAVALAIALLAGLLARSEFAGAVTEGVSGSIDGIKTVAAMIADRSPGTRPEGALAALKHKKHTVLSELGQPAPIPPATTLGRLLMPQALPPVVVPPVGTPLYGLVAGPPVLVVPPVGGGSPGIPASGGGPGIIVPAATGGGGGGGGGGGVIPPTTTLVTTPDTPAVPEPSSWAMMLTGFALIGFALRRSRLCAHHPLPG